MKLYLFYECVQHPLVVEIPDNEVEGFMREYEEALHDTAVETFKWKGSCLRINGLSAILRKDHIAK